MEGEPLQFTTANRGDGAVLPGTFGLKYIGSIRFSMSRYSTCYTLFFIFVPNCTDVISFMDVRHNGHMISVLERLRELVFHNLYLWLLVAWGPLLQLFSGSLL